MKSLLLSGLILLPLASPAAILYNSMVGASTTSTIPASWAYPDGSDGDVHSYDNFRINQTADVTDVYWRADTPTARNFSIRIYRDLLNGVNAYQPVITQLPPDETSSGYLYGFNINNFSGSITQVSAGRWDYHVVLPTSIRLQGNTHYWMKVSARTYMSIANAVGQDNRHYAYFTGGPYFLYQSGDMAFRLDGIVPEPGSVVAWGLGACLLLLRLRARQGS